MRTIMWMLLFVPSLVFSATIKIATWNIEHLISQPNSGPNPRSLTDYERLTTYVDQLDADIVALQEVDGARAAELIFDPSLYRFFFSNRDHSQRTGFAIKNHLLVTQNPDYTELNTTGGLRHGADVTVTISGKSIRLLSVHLKSGCFSKPRSSTSDACTKLKGQLPILEKWIDKRAAERHPFIVIGDFNRRLDKENDFVWREIDDANPPNADLMRPNAGHRSKCWFGEYPEYIDHIVLDRQSSQWLVENSFEQLVFEEPASLKRQLSDHCAIAATLSISEDLEGTPSGFKQQLLDKIGEIERLIDELRELADGIE